MTLSASSRTPWSRLAAVVLAAGAGLRFGGSKLTALLDGQPILQHVLDTVALVRPLVTVVVVPPTMAGHDLIAWRQELQVVNRDPGQGLSSSLRLGVEACLRHPGLDGVCILLGDQPRTAVSTLTALGNAVPEARAAGALAVLPVYAGGGGANPVVLLPAGFALVPQARGDRGLGVLLRLGPGLTYPVELPGSNPDIDTLDDLRQVQRG